MPKFNAQTLCILTGWIALAFIAYATLCPIDDRPVVAGLQFEHFAAFALTGLAFILGWPKRTVLIVAILLGSAFTLETLQLLTPDRHGRLIDAFVKAAGGMCGIGIGYLAPILLRNPINRIKEGFGPGRSG